MYAGEYPGVRCRRPFGYSLTRSLRLGRREGSLVGRHPADLVNVVLVLGIYPAEEGEIPFIKVKTVLLPEFVVLHGVPPGIVAGVCIRNVPVPEQLLLGAVNDRIARRNINARCAGGPAERIPHAHEVVGMVEQEGFEVARFEFHLGQDGAFAEDIVLFDFGFQRFDGERRFCGFFCDPAEHVGLFRTHAEIVEGEEEVEDE